MTVGSEAEATLKAGDPSAALQQLQEAVRAHPADARLRIFLFQLLCVLGQWERALNQLKVASGLDASAIPMAQTYGEAVRCEAIRRQVFAGKTSPMIFGEPEQWLALLIESLLVDGRGNGAQSESLRLRAFDEAEASSGSVDGRPFEWLSDADSRLGPVLEAVINARYYWVPYARLAKITIEAPTDLRDVVWMPAHLEFENGGESVALIPTRYPGSEKSEDGAILLSRKTTWDEVMPGRHHGLGQRLLATDSGDVPLMDVREIVFAAASAAGGEHG